MAWFLRAALGRRFGARLEQYPFGWNHSNGFLALEVFETTARNPLALIECERIVL
jgi:hypothetical protein